ncbi:hypothetical protein, partial [Streptomyces sp. NPDC050507]|uniref:hypothetical protein n=1 Tax=Streptomyces sp. NPDC050507 TaxID=3365619 RepID=UPI0037B499AB
MTQHLGHSAADQLQYLASALVVVESRQAAEQLLPVSGSGHRAGSRSSGGGGEVAEECGDRVGTSTQRGDIDRQRDQSSPPRR